MSTSRAATNREPSEPGEPADILRKLLVGIESRTVIRPRPYEQPFGQQARLASVLWIRSALTVGMARYGHAHGST